MGGLLAAEIVLKSPVPPTGWQAFEHRILGTVNFDTPFLGMHPGVISSGLASLFRSPDSPEVKPQKDGGSSGVVSPSSASLQSPSTATLESGDGGALSPTSSITSTSTVSRPGRQDTLFSPAGSDPTFNPKFNNDVNLPIRKGWEKTLHFLNKHSKHVVKAGQQYVKSHLEFGGAMADYPALKQRYTRIRTLEDEDENQRASGQAGRIPKQVPIPRIRFVNYYTASTGRPKKEKSRSPSKTRGEEEKESQTLNPPDVSATASVSSSRSPSPSPAISIEEHREDGSVEHKEAIIPETPKEENEGDDNSESTFEVDEVESVNPASIPGLPPLPPLPMEPAAVNLDLYQDKDVKKAVQREHNRAVKAYKQAVKNRERALKDRAKIEDKYKKRVEKSAGTSKAVESSGKELKSKNKADIKPKNMDKGKAPAAITLRDNEARDEPKPPSSTELVATTSSSEAPSTTQESQPVHPTTDTDDEEAAILARYRTAESALLGSNQSKQPPTKPALSPLETNPQPADHDRGRTLSPAPSQAPSTTANEKGKAPAKPKKDKKFCTLPPKASDGSRDPTWIRVFMRDVDEVGAHCGLFLQEGKNAATYEMLVGEVSAKVEEWVREDMSARFVASGGH